MSDSLEKQFLDFARSKPADEAYPAYDICGCAMFQFLEARGEPVASAGFQVWRDFDGRLHDAWPFRIGDLLSIQPHTFGALAERLEAALAS